LLLANKRTGGEMLPSREKKIWECRLGGVAKREIDS